MKPIKDLPKRFVEEYLIDFNGAQAAIRAGYKPHSARKSSNRLLGRPEVQAALNEAIEARSRRTEITQDRILQEIARLAFFDIRLCYDDQDNLVPVSKMSDDAAAALSGVDVVLSFKRDEDGNPDPETTKKIRIWDKVKALELAGKHLKMFTDVKEVTGKNGGPIETNQIVTILNYDPNDPESVARAHEALFGAPQALRDLRAGSHPGDSEVCE